ncbi:hypothetical protein SPRA44_670050 [Serratia proteamaculans]|nr:hypothetical protein SPRA44_670050 [Serratia proteamaculans]
MAQVISDAGVECCGPTQWLTNKPAAVGRGRVANRGKNVPAAAAAAFYLALYVAILPVTGKPDPLGKTPVQLAMAGCSVRWEWLWKTPRIAFGRRPNRSSKKEQ